MTGLEVTVGRGVRRSCGPTPGAVTGWILHRVRAPYAADECIDCSHSPSEDEPGAGLCRLRAPGGDSGPLQSVDK